MSLLTEQEITEIVREAARGSVTRRDGSPSLRKAENVRVGDKVCFELASADYIVTEIEQTRIGMVRHQHKDGSSSYWPHELLYVESFDAK